ncbi:MAG: enterotoxin [Phycisphaerae bacterium]|nr:enterotoxin [Phycisphaerae bacterium]
MLSLEAFDGWPTRFAMIFTVCWSVAGGLQRSFGVEFPGETPGPATVRREADRIVLRNDVIAAMWSISQGRLRLTEVKNHLTGDHAHGDDQELFVLGMADGSQVRASELPLSGQCSLVKLESRPDAISTALHHGGWQAVATMTAGGDLRVEWRATLRDGSNYVRQQITVCAGSREVPIRRADLLSVRAPDARTIGEVDGSPIVAGTLFLSCESPMATNRIEGDRATCSMPVYCPPRPGRSWTGGSVIGVVPKGQLRRAFLHYIERERPRPYRSFLHYNSWYDIAWSDRKMNEAQCLDRIERFSDQLTKQRGTRLDAFVFDDGWDDNKTLWLFHSGFPNGFGPLVAAAKKADSALGVWLSPWGGYGPAKAERLEYGRTQGFETNHGGFSLAGPTYYERFRSVCIDMIRKYGMAYFKFDGIGKGSAAKGAGAEFGPDIEALFRLLADLRAVKPDLFLNVTAGTWPSPFWLWHSDAVWRGGGDANHLGAGSMRQQWLTYRDTITYRKTARGAPLFPLNSLKSQGLCLGQLGKNYAKMAADPKDVIDEIRMMMVSGTQLQDLFVTPELMTSEMWDALAEAAAWCRANADVLVDSHWVGGDPSKAEVYGYASWSPRKGILGLRNPSDKEAGIDLDIGRAFELPDSSPRRYRLKSPWKLQHRHDNLVLEAGRPHRLTLQPFETLVLDALPVDTQ